MLKWCLSAYIHGFIWWSNAIYWMKLIEVKTFFFWSRVQIFTKACRKGPLFSLWHDGKWFSRCIEWSSAVFMEKISCCMFKVGVGQCGVGFHMRYVGLSDFESGRLCIRSNCAYQRLASHSSINGWNWKPIYIYIYARELVKWLLEWNGFLLWGCDKDFKK